MSLQTPSRTTFAATVMVLIGSLQALSGASTVRDSSSAFGGAPMMRAMDSHLFSLDALAWGWIHLIIGIALVAVGLVLALYSQRDPWPTAGIATTILSGVAMFWVPLDITAGYQQVLAYVVVLFALTTDPDRTSDDEQLDDEV